MMVGLPLGRKLGNRAFLADIVVDIDKNDRRRMVYNKKLSTAFSDVNHGYSRINQLQSWAIRPKIENRGEYVARDPGFDNNPRHLLWIIGKTAPVTVFIFVGCVSHL